MEREDDVAGGLMVIHGNHPEALRDVLVAWMKRHPLAPLENELILVQSNGIAQWLKMALAADEAAGGCGIAAALDAFLPSRFVWQAYRAVLGRDAVPEVSPFDKPLLVWRLMRLLPALLARGEFAPLARFLSDDEDLRKRHQLAERLADLFDQYQMYRADWLAAWADGEDVVLTARGGREPLPAAQAWQPALWRALLEDVGPALAGSGRAAVHTRFLAAVADMRDAPRPPSLPRRVMVFGISSLPAQTLEVLAAIAQWSQVLLCVHNPCEHYWADIVADKDLLRATASRHARRAGMPAVLAEEALHLHAHPLLAAWGKQGRDFIGLLDEHDAGDARERYARRFAEVGTRIDLFAPHGDDCLLHQLQDDFRDLRPLAETRARWPAVDPATDASIRFHVAHGPQREVEILHDQLLAAFNADETLRPRDVIVMVPDIDAYAPHIQAVFGLMDAEDPRFIPFTVADQGLRHHDPLLNAVEKLLGLPQSRVAVSDVLDLLEVPALRARFGIAEDDVPLLHRWVRGANIRWGLHAEQRASLGLPDGAEQNSWLFGLRRMLLGYAVGSAGNGAGGATEAWQGIEPYDEIGGLDAGLVGPLATLLERLDAAWRGLREPAAVADWCLRLRGLLADFFDPADATGAYTLERLEAALQAWQDACAAAGLTEALPLSVVREHWLAQMGDSGLAQRFFAGAVTFATLMPMRAIPFRHVCLLGMNDGDYPRTRVPMDFDLMGRDWRPGDRSRREDDRYLFLEALLSARECLHVSWVGRSIHDNTARPPSVLVGQLRDHLAAGWRLAGDEGGEDCGDRLLAALTVEHRLQPFSPDYFPAGGTATALFTYAREWREGLGADAAAEDSAPLAPLDESEPLTLRELADFLKEPARVFLRRRLGVYFELPDPAAEDHEPFALDALQNWQLQDELIGAQLDALRRGEERETALERALARIERRGELAPGRFAALMQAELAEPMSGLFERYARALADWPEAIEPDEDVAFEHAVGTARLVLADRLGSLRRNAEGARGRLVLERGSVIEDGKYRRDKLVGHWIAHVAGHLGGVPLTSRIVSKAGDAPINPLAPEAAREYFRHLLEAWRAGLARPLPLAVKTAFAWIGKGGRSDTPLESDAGREARIAFDGDGYKRRGERAYSAYLARTWPDFDALWADGEFALLADRLLRPLYDAVGARGGKVDAAQGNEA
ncbi:exodeoxyribonuclease V subunit gamma [Aromatoleum petrolei]|uniref:RecBCD enzyme subunit RecC n=1 Tax=Aromatoleum petrolei TaxID=76116 RepID=A0ABX1MU14_9RHOO|nr:exodeoxyribonuclease V subunit gamma [Aromatoleum petrolei]NMF91445.1 exodeoxyribonuclease V subunit gamma [Aromatoleum petrolei]QTQ36866.1 RecBCD enzyme, subunit C [Aromatoleum petrolei]